jgi:hypothetical protein
VATVAETSVIKFVDPAMALTEAAALMPVDTVFVVVVDVTYFKQEMLARGMGIAPEGFDAGPMFNDLGALSEKRFGVDMTKTRWALFGMTEQEQPFLIFKGAFGAPKGFKPLGASGLQGRQLDPDAVLIATGNPNFLVMMDKDPEALEIAEVLSGKRASFKSRLDKSAMLRVLEKTGPAGIAVAGELGDGQISQEIRNELGFPTYPRAGAVSFSDDIVAVVEGDATSLKLIESFISKGIGDIRGELVDEMGNLDNDDPFEAAAIIIAFHMFNAMSDAARPRIEGDNLIIEYRTIAGPAQASSLAASFFFLGMGPGMMFMMF